MSKENRGMTFFNTAPSTRSKKYLKYVEDGKLAAILKAVDAERSGSSTRGTSGEIKIRRLGVKAGK